MLELIEASPTGSPYPTPPACNPINCFMIPAGPELVYPKPAWRRLGGDPH